MITIGLDLMGGDYAPNVVVEGACLALPNLPENVSFYIFGDENIGKELLKNYEADPNRFNFVHSDEVISYNDSPLRAFKSKPNSSIVKGFEYLHQGIIDGFASAGNTGAMLIGATQIIKPIDGIERPVISSLIPKENGNFSILMDAGLNADCKPKNLEQFALMGSIYASTVFGIDSPRVALLNVGEEEQKGNILSKSTYQLLKENEVLNFVGNIESRDILFDHADVIICDGFTGNIILKQLEGFYSLLTKRNLVDEHISKFNYENYGGTPVLGINGNVIIGHGISSSEAIKSMILTTFEICRSNLKEELMDEFQLK